jgi:hypothetical protein
LGLDNKDKPSNSKYQHGKAHNKSSYKENIVATEHYEKSGNARKKETYRHKVDLTFKKSAKNQMEAKESISLKQPVQLAPKGGERYEWERKVGAGTFGTVHKARDRKTLEVVAIKKVFQDPKYKNRELEILKMLKHPNVLEIKEHFLTY